MIIERINNILNHQSKEILNIKYINENIDFFDIFPKSEIDKKHLENEAIELADLILKSERGNFYKFKNPITTIFGQLEYFKIRWFDKTKLKYGGSPDFVIVDMEKFSSLYGNDKRFTFTEQKQPPKYKCYKFQTGKTWACFMDSSVTNEF